MHLGRVLIIEDDVGVAEVLAYGLRKAGARDVVVANDGVTGLQRARQERPDLILCDVMMPGLSGIEVCRALKQGRPPIAAPFVFLTAATGTAFRDRSPQSYGAAGAIAKPIKLADLPGAIRKILAERSAADSTGSA